MRSAQVLLAVLFPANAMLLQSAAQPKQEEQSVKLKVAYEYVGASLPLAVATARGLFKANGVDVVLENLAGRSHFFALKYDIVFGREFDIFSQAGATPEVIRFSYPYGVKKDGDKVHLLIVKKDAGINGLKDLKGKTILLNTDPYLFWNYVLPTFGLTEKDVTCMGDGGTYDTFAKSYVDATYCAKDTASRLRKQDPTARVLAYNLEAEFISDPYYFGCTWINGESLKTGKTAIMRFMKAIDQAIDLIRAKPQESLLCLRYLFKDLNADVGSNIGVYWFQKSTEPPDFVSLEKRTKLELLREFYLQPEDKTRAETSPLVAAPTSQSQRSPAELQTPPVKTSSIKPQASREEVVNPTGLPADLTPVAEAAYMPLEGLASGAREAQDRQRQAVRELGLPLEVKTQKTGIVFRLVPAGSFTMGASKVEQDAMVNAGVPRASVEDETQHQVTLSRAFYCGKFEVTQGQWEQVMGSNPSLFRNAGRDAPVERVSWDDCQAFVEKLCQIEGVSEGTYGLLTEAQWEYACRAGTQTPLYNGDLMIKGENNGPALDSIAWYAGNSAVDYEGAHDSSGWSEKQYNHKQAGTHPVGGRHANGFGLCDMIGNVLEWCQDWYGEYSSGVAADPLGPAAGDLRVVRGGSWSMAAGRCRSADRDGLTPVNRVYPVGLRLVRATASHASQQPGSLVDVRAGRPQDVTQLEGRQKTRAETGLKGVVTGLDLRNKLAEISIGSTSGVKVDMKFYITRGDQFVCNLLILEVEPDKAVGILDMVQQPPKVGDTATTQF